MNRTEVANNFMCLLFGLAVVAGVISIAVMFYRDGGRGLGCQEGVQFEASYRRHPEEENTRTCFSITSLATEEREALESK